MSWRQGFFDYFADSQNLLGELTLRIVRPRSCHCVIGSIQLAVLIFYCSICLNVLVCYFSKITLGILELTEPYSKMVVRIVVMDRATRAGTAERSIQKQHQLRITRTTAGIKVVVMKYGTRLLKVKNACRLVKDPLFTDKKTNASLCM